jgi:hypothetical protein
MGGRLAGTTVDPHLVGPGNGGTFDDATRLNELAAYALRRTSPLIDLGVEARDAAAPSRDFHGTGVPQGGRLDVGAHEWTPASELLPAPEVVLYAADVPSPRGWTLVADSSAAGGSKLATSDAGWSSTAAPLESPTQYFDVTFNARANTRYRVWLRLQARNASKWNDSVFVQFSGAVTAGGTPLYRIGTASGLMINMATCADCPPAGWGWQNRAYWLGDTGEVWFGTTGTHRLRVQVREDGAAIDQIVISSSLYLDRAPGPAVNDTTIVGKGP